jgi:hypothetical protein
MRETESGFAKLIAPFDSLIRRDKGMGFQPLKGTLGRHRCDVFHGGLGGKNSRLGGGDFNGFERSAEVEIPQRLASRSSRAAVAGSKAIVVLRLY